MNRRVHGGLTFEAVCDALVLPRPTAEYRFAPPRRWRFDYAWPLHKIALEGEGGAWTRGRHTRGSGFIRDMAKYNQAALLGWRVFRVTPDQLLAKGPDLLKRAILWDGLARERARL